MQDASRFLGIGDAWQLDDDLVVTPSLDHGLADAESVDASLQRRAHAVERRPIDRLAGNGLSLEDELQATLEIESLPNGVCRAETVNIEVRARKGDPCRDDGEHDDEREGPPVPSAQAVVSQCARTREGREARADIILHRAATARSIGVAASRVNPGACAIASG